MELPPQQYEPLKDLLPRQRGNVKGAKRRGLSALRSMGAHGGKWRGLPERCGNWPTLYRRITRWAKTGVRDRVFAALQQLAPGTHWPIRPALRLKPNLCCLLMLASVLIVAS